MEIQLWREILTPYELAVKELTVKFQHLIRIFKTALKNWRSIHKNMMKFISRLH